MVKILFTVKLLFVRTSSNKTKACTEDGIGMPEFETHDGMGVIFELCIMRVSFLP